MLTETFNGEYKAFAHLQKDGKYKGIVRNADKDIVYQTSDNLKSKYKAIQKAKREFSNSLV